MDTVVVAERKHVRSVLVRMAVCGVEINQIFSICVALNHYIPTNEL